MSDKEAEQFPGVHPSERDSYIRLIDAKTNYAPPVAGAVWYRWRASRFPTPKSPHTRAATTSRS
jgi:hypothetical protein